MDSDDDIMYDAEEDFNDDHDSNVNDMSDDDEDDEADAEEDDEVKANYTVLGKADIGRLQDNDVTRVCAVLSISRDSARLLLHHYKWRVGRVLKEWFADETKVRKAVGLVEKPAAKYFDLGDRVCGICFDRYDYNEMRAAACRHLYCNPCWERYVSVAVNDGAGCLGLRCPEPSCTAAVGQETIDGVASREDRERYSNYLLRSYIENYRKTKWCPAPGCDYAVQFDADGNGSYDVACNCSYDFCWNCCEEVHRPADCETVLKWNVKNSAESENTTWILANTKPCPECKRPIEKNQGCMHMTCAQCNFQFCWLCLNEWKDHGDFYSCNNYAKAKSEGLYDEAEKRMQNAKDSLEKYTHYFERWASNNASGIRASANLKKVETRDLKILGGKQCQAETELKFILDAWKQIIECRRVLKWTYAYGYYLPEGQLVKKKFFEYLQGEAENALERLHKCAETELQTFHESELVGTLMDSSLKPFEDFRVKLIGLTSATRTYFENLVGALQNGLSDVSNTEIVALATGDVPSYYHLDKLFFCDDTATADHLSDEKRGPGSPRLRDEMPSC